MSSAEGPAPVAIGGEPKPKSGTAAAETPKQAHIASSQANRLASLASGGATTFLIGGVAAVVLALFPLRLADRQWQLGVLANLVSNGSWILIGLVLLHLASMLEPRNRALSQRLMLWRRLAALAAVAYLLIVPLQVTITWLGVDASRNERERIISKSETQLKGYRDALMGAPNLTDLKERLGAIPGAPPLPEQASLLPYAEVRKQLLLQLEQAESRLRQRLESLPPPPNPLELGRQTARVAIASLMLALGFASGAEGLFGQASLLESLKLPVGSAENKPAKGNRFKGLGNQFQWIKQWLNLPKRSAIRPISKPRSRALQLPLQLKIPRQWQFWSKRFWRKKKRSSRRRIRESR
jgi:hypothetical protein